MAKRIFRNRRRLPASKAFNSSLISIYLTVVSIVIALALAVTSFRKWLEDFWPWFLLGACLPIAYQFVRAQLFAANASIRRRGWLDKLSASENKSELTRFNIQQLVIQQLNAASLRFYGVHLNDKTTIADLILIYTRLLYPDQPKEGLTKAILDARVSAFDMKYGDDRKDDEKKIGQEKFGDWTELFREYCRNFGIQYTENPNTLEVGFGTGCAYENNPLFEEIHGAQSGVKFLTDISPSAVRRAKKRFKGMKHAAFLTCSAEALSDLVQEDSIDFYISLRTYSSSFFDIRRALVEAKRVLKPGGQLVISIPHLYIERDGSHKIGLMRDVATGKITQSYRDEVVRTIKDYLVMLEFEAVNSSTDGKFESFVSCQKGVAN